MFKKFTFAAAISLVLAGCATVPNPEDDFQAAKATLAQHIQTLASAEYGGREPGTEGGRKTQAYIADALTNYGFQPGASADSFFQPVELARIAPGEGTLTATGLEIASGDDALFRTGTADAAIEDSRVTVFSAEAEEPREGALRNRTAVIFSEMLFNGKATPLLDSDADALVIISSSDDVFARLKRAFSSNRLRLASESNGTPAYVVLSPAAGEQLAESLGSSVSGLKDQAAKIEGGEYQLRKPVSITAKSNADTTSSANVIGKLPGKVPGSGAVLVLAHWDHLGECGPEDAEDRLCNGAVDNASGVGVMLEAARRVATSGGLDRDLYIMGTTAEESGLLGAEAFAANPPMPLPTIVAAFNIDTVAIAPRGASTTVVGWGRTPLDEGIKQVVESIGGTFKVDEYTDQFVRRQDGWALLSRDVPAVLVSTSFGDEAAFSGFLSGPYHQASDQWRDDLELGGATDDIFTHVALLKHFGNVGTYQPGTPSVEE